VPKRSSAALAPAGITPPKAAARRLAARRLASRSTDPPSVEPRENRLNDLSGAEWLFWTSTVFETSYPADASHRLRKQHGAMKPPELMANIIRFFTKHGELVLDPFAGVGGTLLGAELCGRRSIGFEICPAWGDIYEQIRHDFVVDGEHLAPRHKLAYLPASARRAKATLPTDAPACSAAQAPLQGDLRIGDCMELFGQVADESIDAVISDPPYGCQHGATGFKSETNFCMVGGPDPRDFSNAQGMPEFLARMEDLGREAWRVLKPGRYLVLIIGDRYQNSEYVPLGVMVAETMRRVGFQFKGMRLWWNKATQRPLRPYAVKTCFVPNIVHQNILVLRKV
jgi:DNA modification methylase